MWYYFRLTDTARSNPLPAPHPLGPIVSIAGAVQWFCGLILAFFMLNQAASRGGSSGPRVFIVLGMGLFVLAGLDLALALAGAPPVLGRWLPVDFASERSQFLLILFVCGAAWLSLFLAAVWTGVVDIRGRRRLAAADIERRTAVALRGVEHAKEEGFGTGT